MERPSTRLPWAAALTLCATLSMPATPQSKVLLPDIGDSAGSVISPAEERALGLGVLRSLSLRGLLIDDPQLESYVESVGQRVLNGNIDTKYRYTFFLIDDSSINAFAAPGGFIGVHAGLILATDYEDELASVLAHEIAHVEQRHAARAFEAARKFSFTQAAALLAGLLVGQANPQAGAAALYAGVAGSQQMAINFTRENEYEADRIGIGILAEAGFDPDGMASFFEKLMLQEGRGSLQIEYLRTHPVNSSRVSEARGRADDLPRRSSQVLPDYDYAVARLRSLTYTNDPLAAGRLMAMADAPAESSTPVQRYELALALRKAGRLEYSLKVYETLLAEQPDNLWFRLGRNETLQGLSRNDLALADYRRLMKLYPGHYPVVVQTIKALIEEGNTEEAVRIAQSAAATDGRPRLYLLLGQAHRAGGDQGRAFEAIAEYYFLQGELEESLGQLDKALDRTDIDHVARRRLTERREQIRGLVQAR